MKQLMLILHPKLLAETMPLVAKLQRALPNVEVWHAVNSEAEKVLIPVCQIDPCVETIVLTVGGDGTFVTGARIAKHLANVYVVGVHAGNLGFLATWEAKGMSDIVNLMQQIHASSCLEEDYHISPRHFVSYWGRVGDNSSKLAHALNDFVITSPKSDTMISYTMAIGASKYETFRQTGADNLAITGKHRANGLIIASATGSTAYSLAEKGALINPDGARCLQVAPIAAPSLTSRPIVVTDNGADKVKVVIGVEGLPGAPVLVKGDNLVVDTITDRQDLIFGVSLTPVKVLQPKGQTWYATLAEKLHWNTEETHLWRLLDD